MTRSEPFLCAHATHPDWGMATALVLAQLQAQLQLQMQRRPSQSVKPPLQQPKPSKASKPQSSAQHLSGLSNAAPRLALVYMTDAYAAHADALLRRLRSGLPQVTDWVGTVGIGILVSGVEYLNEPALAVMLLDIPPEHYRVFNGLHPLTLHGWKGTIQSTTPNFSAHTALVHVDGHTPDLPELVSELAARTQSGRLFGGVSSHHPHAPSVQMAVVGHAAAPQTPPHTATAGQANAQVFHGGFSGVAFAPQVGLVTAVTQGCLPVSPVHTITQAEGPVILRLDDRPALGVLLQDLALQLEERHTTIPKLRQTLVGLSHHVPLASHPNTLGDDVRVRHLIGLDIDRQGIAIAATPEAGELLQFCQRDAAATHTDLVRICTDVRDTIESSTADLPAPQPPTLKGAIYISCTGRGGPYLGAPHAEAQLIRRALGDVPLIGFFAGGEIAGQQLYAYTGVLTVFWDAPDPLS